MELVRQKHLCAGTVDEQKACETCSAGIRKEFWKYVSKEKERLLREPPASKGWWSMTRRLLGQQEKVCSIPALKTTEGEWCRDAKSKADHLAVTFKAKYKMPEKTPNYYSELEAPYYKKQGPIGQITEELAEKILEDLRSDSATGPDELPARVLKECAKVLAVPLCALARLIVQLGRWPELWVEHWIIPLYKKNSVFKAGNYRGVHLTAQLSKAMERLLRVLFMPYLLDNLEFGPNQFAYITERGA